MSPVEMLKYFVTAESYSAYISFPRAASDVSLLDFLISTPDFQAENGREISNVRLVDISTTSRYVDVSREHYYCDVQDN